MKSPVSTEEWAAKADDLQGLLEGKTPVPPKKELTVDEINIELQEAAIRDRKGVYESPFPPLELPEEPERFREDWAEYKSRLPEYGPPPEELAEEVV